MSDIVLKRQTYTKENVWFEGQKSYFNNIEGLNDLSGVQRCTYGE